MKKLLFGTALCMAFFSVANAQTEMGNWLVGGNLSLNAVKNDTRIGLTPSAGYFFARNFAAGAMLNVAYAKLYDVKNSTLGVGPFARYYFGTLNFRPFVDGELAFQTQKTKTPGTSNTFSSTQYFLGGGLAAFINRNVAVEGLLGYSRTAVKNQDGNGGLNFRVGFQVYINRGEVASMSR